MAVSPVHVAQINIGTMIAPTDDPSVAEFMASLDRVNAVADESPGFVWRLQGDDGNATSIQVFPDPLELVNMSVWETVDDLKAYVYRSEHVDFFRRRAEWFEPDAKRVALWYVPAGEVPGLDEAVRRVEFQERHGPTPYSFGFGRPPAPLVFEPTGLDDPETLDLVSRSTVRAATTEPGEHSLATAGVADDRGRMVRARYDGELVGCGAVRRTGPTTGDLHRMYVDERVEGEQIGAALRDQLELWASRVGIRELRPDGV